jgi:hypothetical protein
MDKEQGMLGSFEGALLRRAGSIADLKLILIDLKGPNL